MVADRPDIDSRVMSNFKVDDNKIEKFLRRTQDFSVDLVVGCSLWPESLKKVNEKLNGRHVDILLIDGCHHPFEAVWGDFETYYPLVCSGGYVVFDDLYEECILKVYKKAQDDFNMIEVDRWSVSRPEILQDCGALKKGNI
jgi:cephalosporin hydroxylase